MVVVIVGEDPSTVSAGGAVQIIFGGPSKLVSSGKPAVAPEQLNH